MKKAPWVIKKYNVHFWITFNFWSSAKWSEQIMLTKTQKRPPKPSKNKMFIFRLHSTSDHRLSNLSKKHWPKHKNMKKGPQSHRKIKCSFLDYFQLLMIGQAIWAKILTKMQRNKKGPLSHQKMKCLFLDYVQLLMIGWVIWVMNSDWNT